MATAAELADQFNAAMVSGDEQALRSILADDVTFAGPLASANGLDECVTGMAEMARITASDDVAVQLADDSNALVWSTLTTKAGPATETATWLKVANGKIAAIRTVFDPRAATGR